MAEQRPTTETNPRQAPAAPNRQSAPGTPRWVWALGLVVGILIVVFVLAQLLFGVQHGPGMHGAAGEIGSTAPTASTGATGNVGGGTIVVS